MGMLSVYRKHIPQSAQIIEPLQNLLNSSQPAPKTRKNKANLLLSIMEPTYDWIPHHSEYFSALKERLSKSVPLCHISQDTTLSLTTDASETAIGAAIHEVSSSDKNRLLAFFLDA